MNQVEQKFPLISVVTVSLNAAEFIEQTIKSVLSQTYPHIEYIIIDGGSTDGTIDIIRRYESGLTYWHSKPDRGLSHAFNLGLEHSNGDWILYLNADDFFLSSTVVKTMIPYLIINNDYDVVYGKMIYMTQSKNPAPAPFRKVFGEPWSWQKFRWTDTIPHQASFINRHFFDRKGSYDESFNIVVDYELFLRGGKDLRALFIPFLIGGMREGGLSGANIFRNIKECRLARKKNHVLPNTLVWLIYFYEIGRFYVGRMLHKLVDRFAHRIVWPGRNSAISFC